MLNPAGPVSPQVWAFRDSDSPRSDVATGTVVTQGRDLANKLKNGKEYRSHLNWGMGNMTSFHQAELL